MFIAAQFTTAKVWNQPRCPSMDAWRKKMWYIYTMEFYSAIMKNEIMPFAGKWMELETIIVKEKELDSETYCMFSLTCAS